MFGQSTGKLPPPRLPSHPPPPQRSISHSEVSYVQPTLSPNYNIFQQDFIILPPLHESSPRTSTSPSQSSLDLSLGSIGINIANNDTAKE